MKLLGKRRHFCVFFATVMVLIFWGIGRTQDLDSVTIGGQVTDSEKAGIVGASVTATLVRTGFEKRAVTDDEGRFLFIKLEPGTYTLKFSAPGFGTKEQKDLAASAGQNVRLNFTLEPRGINAEQTILIDSDNGPAVDTTRTIVGGTISEREIEELPNVTRNPLNLVLMLGGTSEEALSTRDLAEDRNQNPPTAPAEQGTFSLSGGASYSNNITIDGLDNNDDRSANARFQPSPESIAEIQVISNQFSAEYGRASGGRVNLRTRSGGNKFRGRWFAFFRDDHLNANSWYNNRRGLSRLPLTEFDPGFTLSGPILTNKLFFSAGYEFTVLKDTTLIDTWVPVRSNAKYTLPTGNIGCPSDLICIDTNSEPPADILPYRVKYDTPSTDHRLTLKFDYRWTGIHDFSLGWQFGRKYNKRTVGASTTRLDDALQSRNAHTDAYNLTDNHVFGTRAVNQFRMQYSVFEPSYQTENPFDPVVLIGYRNPSTSSSQTLVSGNSTSGIGGDATAFPQNRRETRWQFLENITYLSGNQIIKTGFDIQTVRSKAESLGDATGTFNFSSFANFQQNTLARYRQNFGTASDVANQYWALFLNDELKIRSDLMISFGLRYERETAVDDHNNFGPRLGIAFVPFRDQKGLVRFGFGKVFNRVLLRTVADSIQNSIGIVPFDTNFIGTSSSDPRRIAILSAISSGFPGIYANREDLHNFVSMVCAPINTIALPCTARTGFKLNTGTNGNPLRSVDANLRIPESYQINFGFERELGRGFVFETNYSRNKTRHLWRDRNVNAPVLPSGYESWTEYLLVNTFNFTNSNGTVRNYNFYLGNDGSINTGTVRNSSGSCSTTTNVTCWVNLNSFSTSTTAPSTAVPGASTNSVGSPIGIALAAIAEFRPDPNFEEKSRIGSVGRSDYAGLIIEIRRAFGILGRGFGAGFRAAYTLSSTKDDGLNNTFNAEVNGNFDREYARSLQDRRHRLVFSGTFVTPKWLGRLKFSPLFRFGSSAPFNLGAGGTDRNLDDLSNDRIYFEGDVGDIVWRAPGTPFPAALAARFTLQPIGSISGNLPRNAGKGPSFYVFDLGLTREFKINEKMKIRPNVEFDNILNAAVFSFGAGFIDFDALGPNASSNTVTNFHSSFLVPNRTYRERQIRLGLRLDF